MTILVELLILHFGEESRPCERRHPIAMPERLLGLDQPIEVSSLPELR